MHQNEIKGSHNHHFLSDFEVLYIFSEQKTMDIIWGPIVGGIRMKSLVIYCNKTWLPFWDLKLPHKTESQPPIKGRYGLFLRGPSAPCWIELPVSSFQNHSLTSSQQCVLVPQKIDKQPFSGSSWHVFTDTHFYMASKSNFKRKSLKTIALADVCVCVWLPVLGGAFGEVQRDPGPHLVTHK